MVSYALIPDAGYQAAIRREYAILIENQSSLRLKKIVKAAPLVGCLVECPECGEWLLIEPVNRKRAVGARKVARKRIAKRGAGPVRKKR